jgi:hypothetical protein
MLAEWRYNGGADMIWQNACIVELNRIELEFDIQIE